MPEIYQQSPDRNSIPFGLGTEYIVPQPSAPLEQINQRVLDLAWSSGCPIPTETIGLNPTLEDLLRSGERYAYINWWFDIIASKIHLTKKTSSYSIRFPVPRREDEPVGKHEPEYVPLVHMTHMSPLSHPVGFALPRIAIEMTKEPTDMRGFVNSLIGGFAATCTSSSQLLARVAEFAACQLYGGNPMTVLNHVLRQQKLNQEGCISVYEQIVRDMEQLAPNLLRIYVGLSTTEKISAGIIETI